MTTTAPDSVLPVAECIRLLRSVPVGRMVFTENAAPALRPVTFAAVGAESSSPPTTSGSNASMGSFSHSKRGTSIRSPESDGA
ncbi:hypothetical protein E143388_07494 [Rhodococcus opacus]|nr:hypothetical protein E143388_07494 [Rhodococcus opacus]